ncbi:MAG: hypothetical protein U0166_04460 [Acidobacteriota bacterium]
MPRPLRRLLDGIVFVQTQVLLVVSYFVLVGAWSLGARLAGSDPLHVHRKDPGWEPFTSPTPEDAERQY